MVGIVEGKCMALLNEGERGDEDADKRHAVKE
jgi:hypothetical protein